MPIPPPPELFDRPAAALPLHLEGRAGLLLGFTGFYVVHHASTAIQWAFSMLAGVIAVLWWQRRGATGTPATSALPLMHATLGLSLGWSLAWLVRTIGSA